MEPGRFDPGKIFYTKEIIKAMDNNKEFAMEIRIYLEKFYQQVMKKSAAVLKPYDDLGLVIKYPTCEGDISICENPTIVTFSAAV